ncbi:MAG: hypothetical protein JW829_06350 [Pirellulales bacterium]|nr:hypothetical protein [Pirellulales bacterium]
MHARELVELAASVATHVGTILADPSGLREEGLEAYWFQSRKRLDAWATAMIPFEQAAATKRSAQGSHAEDMLRLAEEVLASEILTRIWAAVLSGASHLSTYHITVATGRSIFLNHQEIRLRILKWMINGPLAGSPSVEALNLFRRRCERWTDLFLGRIALVTETTLYAFDSDRLAEFHKDFQGELRAGTLDTSWNTLLASLSCTLEKCLHTRPVCSETNTEIATAVLTCLGSNSINEWATLRWAWLHRLECTISDAQRLLADLLAGSSDSLNRQSVGPG